MQAQVRGVPQKNPYEQYGAYAEFAQASDQAVSNLIRMNQLRSQINDPTKAQDNIIHKKIEEAQGNIEACLKVLDPKALALIHKEATSEAKDAALDAQKAANEKRRQQILTDLDAKASTLDTKESALDAKAATLDAQKAANEKRRQQILAALAQKKQAEALKAQQAAK